MSQHTVWVFSDIASRYPELLAGAKQLSADVRAFVVGDDAAPAFAHGAGTVVLLPDSDTRMVEDLVPTMAAVIRAQGSGVVLIAATRRGKAVAAKLGFALQGAVINEASAVRNAEGLTVSRMLYGGLAVGEEAVESEFAVITVGGGVFEAGPADGATGEIIRPDVVEPVRSVTRLERRPKAGSSVDLARAKRVVSVGRGLKAQADLDMVNALASVMQAETGCSRPVAEGENWMERERYVGVTGVMLKADLYLAFGISGQIQHMVGLNGCKTIVAVNKDKNAPIFESTDYGLVGDMYKVIPALTALLKAN